MSFFSLLQPLLCLGHSLIQRSELPQIALHVIDLHEALLEDGKIMVEILDRTRGTSALS